MKYYCMCKITGKVPDQARDTQGFGPPDNQCYAAPNRYGLAFDGEEHRPVLLGQPMECLQMGATQAVCLAAGLYGRPPRNNWPKNKDDTAWDLDKLSQSKRHHSDVDIYRCRHCGAEIVVEG